MPAEDGYEEEFVKTFLEDGEVVVPLFEANTFVESGDKTREYIMRIIEDNDLWEIGDNRTVTGGRYTKADGHHYWVRMWDYKERKWIEKLNRD